MVPMTTQTAPKQEVTPPKPPRNRHRVFMWFFLALQAIFLAWLIGGIANNVGMRTHGSEAAQTGAQMGTTLGFVLVFGVWIGVDFILGIGRLIVLTARKHKEV